MQRELCEGMYPLLSCVGTFIEHAYLVSLLTHGLPLCIELSTMLDLIPGTFLDLARTFESFLATLNVLVSLSIPIHLVSGFLKHMVWRIYYMSPMYLFLVSEMFLKQVLCNICARHKWVFCHKSVMNYIILSWFCLL